MDFYEVDGELDDELSEDIFLNRMRQRTPLDFLIV